MNNQAQIQKSINELREAINCLDKHFAIFFHRPSDKFNWETQVLSILFNLLLEDEKQFIREFETINQYLNGNDFIEPLCQRAFVALQQAFIKNMKEDCGIILPFPVLDDFKQCHQSLVYSFKNLNYCIANLLLQGRKHKTEKDVHAQQATTE